MSKSLLNVIGVFILALVLMNLTTNNPTWKNLKVKAQYYSNTNKPREVEKCYQELLQNDSGNIEDHYAYIHSHYKIPKRERIGKGNWIYRDDSTIRNYYFAKSQMHQNPEHDYGYYGLGLCASLENDYNAAMLCYDSVGNRKLNYLNNSIGYIYLQENNLQKAETYFRKEIANHGNLSGAYTNLIHVLLQEKRFDELNSLIRDTATNKFFTYNQERSTYFLQGKTFGYFNTIFHRFTGSVNSYGIFGALLILLCWLFFLRKIDVYENEKWKYLLLTCGLGMLLTFGTYLISDFITEYLNFRLNGNVINDFFYAIFGIGAVEEFVKFLPLLVMLLFTKEVNEPIDYIIFASVSALGFAFVENLMYFNENQLFIIHGRALSSVISHMFDASVIGYGLILCRYKYHGNIILSFLIAFLIAAFAHGFYDFWLINDYVKDYGVITFIFMIFTFVWYNIFISNALNNSTFFNKKKILNAEKLKDYLLYSLSSVILLEYLIMSYKYGPTAGNWTLFKSLYSGAFIIFLLSTRLSNFPVKQGEWRPLFDWITKNND
ncbi:MAG: PrsW family intramembrane metalloprotease [Bacteroidetes bacterium]|nr:PrsW family intramembrane metalloprotease [Bacteroidota bacterium]